MIMLVNMNKLKRLSAIIVSFSLKLKRNPSCVGLSNQPNTALRVIRSNAGTELTTRYRNKFCLTLKKLNRSGGVNGKHGARNTAWPLVLIVLLGWVLNATPPPMQSSDIFSHSRTLCEPKKWGHVLLFPKGGARGGFFA